MSLHHWDHSFLLLLWITTHHNQPPHSNQACCSSRCNLALEWPLTCTGYYNSIDGISKKFAITSVFIPQTLSSLHNPPPLSNSPMSNSSWEKCFNAVMFMVRCSLIWIVEPMLLHCKLWPRPSTLTGGCRPGEETETLDCSTAQPPLTLRGIHTLHFSGQPSFI